MDDSANLRKCTISQLRKLAGDNQINIPSSISTKDRIIDYLVAVQLERSYGIDSSFERKNLDLSKLVPMGVTSPSQDTSRWLEHLHTYGWTVVPIPGWGDASNRTEISSTFQNYFFDWLESGVDTITGQSTPFSRYDQTTWKTENLPPNIRGIFKQDLGHTQFQWDIRTLCRPLFAQIWQVPESELICSFDGGSFHLPDLAKRDARGSTYFKEWFHLDQFRPPAGYKSQFISVQGIVHLTDNTTFEISQIEDMKVCTASDGGLILIESDSTRSSFDQYMEAYPTAGHCWGYTNIDHPILKDRRLLRILAPSGYMTLWDSRMFHSSSPAVGANFRMCTYVSFFPRSGADAKTLQRRYKYYTEGRMTGHWCYGPYFSLNAKEARTYGKSYYRPSASIASLTPDQMTMI